MTKTLLTVLMLLLTPGIGPQEEDPFFRFVEIGDGILASLTRDHLNPSSYANAIVFVGETGALVVDAHHAPASGARLVQEISARIDVPIRWLVLTHAHGDHVWGTSAIRAAFPDLEILAHPVTRDSLHLGGQRFVEAEIERVGGILGRVRAVIDEGRVPEGQENAYSEALDRYELQLAGLDEVEVVVPNRVVENEVRLDLGGREVSVMHPGPAHTGGDLVVMDPGTGFLAAGDLLEEAPLWLEGADVRGWAAALERLQRLGPSRVLPSHGRLRPDASLLHAHADFLGEAVSHLAGDAVRPDSASLVQALDRHRALLAPHGVEGGAFEEYVAAIRKGISGN